MGASYQGENTRVKSFCPLCIILDSVFLCDVSGYCDGCGVIFCKQFFKGMGDSYGSIMGIIIAAGVLAAGLTASGLIKGLIALMVQSKEIAQWGGSIGPFVLSVLMGSGDAGAMAFNSAVTPHAQEFGMQIHSLGSLAFLAGAAGRTASPIAGITILVAGLAKANPFDVAKRTFLPMVVAVILLAIFMR